VKVRADVKAFPNSSVPPEDMAVLPEPQVAKAANAVGADATKARQATRDLNFMLGFVRTRRAIVSLKASNKCALFRKCLIRLVLCAA
jgi:hypothetical protein